MHPINIQHSISLSLSLFLFYFQIDRHKQFAWQIVILKKSIALSKSEGID